MSEERKSNENVPYYHCCGFPISGRGVALFWGITLTAIGSVWLLSNLGLIFRDWWEFLFPVLLIMWGVFNVWSARQTYRTE